MLDDVIRRGLAMSMMTMMMTTAEMMPTMTTTMETMPTMTMTMLLMPMTAVVPMATMV